MTDLDNASKWLKIYDNFIVAPPNPNKPGKHYPLKGVVVPTPIDQYTIAVSAVTTEFKPTWKLGAIVFPIITVVGSDIGTAKVNKNYFVSLEETTILKIDKFTTARYRLGIGIPDWFTDIHLQVWVYVGTESIKTTDDKLSEIKQVLEQIEMKIDNYSNQ